MAHLRFKNELGNAIEVMAWHNDGEAEAYRLTVALEGPTSESTNTITESEAVALHAVLSHALYGEPLPSNDRYEVVLP